MKEYLAEKGKLSEQEACGLVCKVLEAVEKIHAKGIIHKDISPDNIFHMEDGSVKIFDFGAARLQNATHEAFSNVVVKKGYTPPEQYRMSGQVDERTDLYAVGALLYQMLTGKKPPEALDRMAEDRLMPPSQEGVTIRKRVEEDLLCALALKKEDRFSTAEEFRLRLQKDVAGKWWERVGKR